MNLLLIMFLVVFMVPLIVAIIEEIKEPAARNQALEKAAKVAEADNNHCGQRIAGAIRALKDKP